MYRKLMALANLSLLAAACSTASPPPSSANDVATSKSSSKKAHESDDAAQKNAKSKNITPFAQREVGDFFVQRISGTFTQTPMTLSEEVIAKGGNLIVVDYTLAEGKNETTLRVTHDIDTERVLRVLTAKGEPASVSAYEKMIAKTVFFPDTNEEKLGSEKSTCLVGADELDCEKTSYGVTVGDKTARLVITTSPEIKGRDVAGEVITDDGNILYKSELIDLGKGSPSDGVASR